MTGEKLKQILKENGYTMAIAARRMDMSPQHLNQALNVADVKSGMLEKVRSSLGISIAHMYGEDTNKNRDIDLTAKQAIYDLTIENTHLRNRVAELEGKKDAAS